MSSDTKNVKLGVCKVYFDWNRPRLHAGRR
jgi:hypothetical protein